MLVFPGRGSDLFLRDAADSEAWFQNTEFRSCAPCAQPAHSMCSCHHAPSPRSHQTNVTSGIIRTRERFSCSITTFLAVLRCESGGVPRRISSSAFSREVAEPRRYLFRKPAAKTAFPAHSPAPFPLHPAELTLASLTKPAPHVILTTVKGGVRMAIRSEARLYKAACCRAARFAVS